MTQPPSTLPDPAIAAVEHARRVWHLSPPLDVAWAPGRVNLLGEHTDYNDGFVLPIAISRVVAVAGQISSSSSSSSSSSDQLVSLYSAQYDQSTTFRLNQLPSPQEPQDQPRWALYVAGVLAELGDAGVPLPGFTAAIDGDVPIGAGVSSSAALVMATLLWLDRALHLGTKPLDLARLGQCAEARGTGVRVGILDHAASILGRPGQAVLLDCRSLEYEYYPCDLPGVGMMLCETGVERSLATSAYNQRREECEAAVAAVRAALAAEGDSRRITALRDVTEHDLLRLGGTIPLPARQRAWHVVMENRRALAAAQALRECDAARFGDLVLASHASLRDNYAVSISELDTVVEIATRDPGALGSRMVGAGFGGAVLIVAQEDLLAELTARLMAEYPARSGRQPAIHPIEAAGGPGHFTIPVA